MKKFIALCTVVLLAVVCSVGSPNVGARRASDARLEKKIEQLERRLSKLERQVLGAAWLSVDEAELNKTVAQDRLGFSQRLFAKGYVNRRQLASDEFALSRANKELELAKAAAAGKMTVEQIATEIDVLDAEQDVVSIKLQLSDSEGLASKGYISQIEVQGLRQAATQAERHLQQMKSKAAATDKTDE